MPHVPGHGSIHLRLEHALLVGQSELETHSGRHCEYGSPKYPLIQLQASLLLLVCILHLLHKDWENMDFSGPSIGKWFLTVHSELRPQAPSHGLMQC